MSPFEKEMARLRELNSAKPTTTITLSSVKEDKKEKENEAHRAYVRKVIYG